MESRVKELERAIKVWENTGNDQSAMIQEWERKESERRAKEKAEGDQRKFEYKV